MSGPAGAAALADGARAAFAFVSGHQRADGSIPAFPDGRLDPWDHVECAMALDAWGDRRAAERAYRWLADAQLPDGSVYAAYRDGEPTDRTRDANATSYVAVGLAHHTLVTGDREFLQEMWPAVEAALDYAVALQDEDGTVYWARDADGREWPDALVAGASSVRAALLSGERLAALLGERAAGRWRGHREALERAFARDERRWGATFADDTARFAMHWYYPVLCGLVTGAAARRRLRMRWDEFVRPGDGSLCVSDRPWVTVAESCELAIALEASGQPARAREVLRWQLRRQDPDGGFRMGTVPAYGPWPERERPSWTAAAFVLAVDAVERLTPGSALFRGLGS